MSRRRNELSVNELSLLKSKVTDEEAWKEFERDCNIRNLRPHTIRFYKNKISATRTTLWEMNINKEIVELNQKEIEEMILFLKERIKVVSINSRIRGLKSFFNFLHKKKIITPNPMKNIKQLRDRRRIMETLEDKEIEMIATYMKEQKTFVGIRDYNIFLLMVDTGIRLSELTGIQIEDVSKNKLTIRNTKNQEERTVYPSKKVKDELNKYMKLRGSLNHSYLFISIDNEPLKSRSIQGRFARYKNELQISKQLSPHIMRHTYAKRSILSGMNAFTLAALLGHSDLSVTKRYVSIWGSDLEAESIKFNTINKLKI